MKIGTFKEDLKDGVFENYNNKGKLLKKEVYKNDLLTKD
jgi:antitoxin component YwqK of YwqJK toxin-antitoxin module